MKPSSLSLLSFCLSALFVSGSPALAGNPHALEAGSASEVTQSGRSFYVGPEGDDAQDGLSPATAMRSPQSAASLTQPGDTVFFLSGEFIHAEPSTYLTITRSGTAERPIIYTPAPGAKPVLRSNGAWDMIKVVGARHIEIRGLRLIGNAPNITLAVAQTEMSNLKNAATCGNGIGITANEALEPSAYVTIRDCEVSDFPGGGIFTNHSDYITFERNLVYRNAFWSPYGNSGLSVYQPTDIDENTGYKIIIRDNICFENYQNIPFFYSNRKDPSKRKVTDGNGIIIDDYLNSQDWGKGTGKPYRGRTLVANNIVFANGGSGIHSFKSTNVDILHNYAVDNNRHPDLKDGQIFANTTKNARILNNVVIAPRGKPVNSSYKNENIVHDGNIYATLDGSAPRYAGELAKNIIAPASGIGLTLSDWAVGNRTFTTTRLSPLRKAGQPLTEALSDHFGRPRDAAAPDIGPFVLDPL